MTLELWQREGCGYCARFREQHWPTVRARLAERGLAVAVYEVADWSEARRVRPRLQRAPALVWVDVRTDAAVATDSSSSVAVPPVPVMLMYYQVYANRADPHDGFDSAGLQLPAFEHWLDGVTLRWVRAALRHWRRLDRNMVWASSSMRADWLAAWRVAFPVDDLVQLRVLPSPMALPELTYTDSDGTEHELGERYELVSAEAVVQRVLDLTYL
jgi:hypothetical protein